MSRVDFEPECRACGRLMDPFGVCWNCGAPGMVKVQVLPGIQLGVLSGHVRLIIQGVFAVGMSAADLRVLESAVGVAAERLESGRAGAGHRMSNTEMTRHPHDEAACPNANCGGSLSEDGICPDCGCTETEFQNWANACDDLRASAAETETGQELIGL